MKFQHRLVRSYFKMTSTLLPNMGGRHAFKLFQKVRKKGVRKGEMEFYTRAKHFKIPMLNEDLNCYELGNVKGDLVILVHGWESNAGSMSNFAFQLAAQDYRVMAFDLPSHALSKNNYTNLYECKEAMRAIVEFINPREPFSVIAHSLGSAMSTYALSELSYPVDKLVLLTSPNKILSFFNDFKEIIGLSKRSYENMLNRASKVMQEDIKQLNILEKLKNITYNKSIIIHDKLDKVLPFAHAEEIALGLANVILSPYEEIGHYRMLWNDQVLDETIHFINN